MCSFLFIVLFTTFLAQSFPLPSSSSSVSCYSSGGDLNGKGVSVTCYGVGDNSLKLPLLPNLAKAVGQLSILSANSSNDGAFTESSVDPSNVVSLTYEGSACDIPDNSFAAFKNLRGLTIDFSRSFDLKGVWLAVNVGQNAFRGLESTLLQIILIGVMNAKEGAPSAITKLTSLEILRFEDCNIRGELKGIQSKNLRHLEIVNSPQCIIPGDLFTNTGEKVEKVRLKKVQAKNVLKSVSSCKALQEFVATQCGLTSVPAGAFQNSAATLKEIRLSDNNISSIESGSLNGLSSLNVLVLSSNEISSLPAGAFDDCVSLETLDLNGNKLTTSSVENAFRRLSKLKQLSIGQNQLDSITAGTLAGIENSVQWLDFSGNKIKSVRGTSKLTKQPQLFLTSNNINSLGPGTIESGSKLSACVLDSNPITTIQSGAFNGITVGPAFSISDTQLVELDLSSLNGLQGCQLLSISDNRELKTIKITSESSVPSSLENIVCENNPRLVLEDPNGKTSSFLKKSNARFLFKEQIYCKCQLGWLRGKSANERKVHFSGNGQNEPTRCCNLDNSVDEYLADTVYKQQCPNGQNGNKKANTPAEQEDEEHC